MSLLDDMAVHFRVGRLDLLRIIESAPARYKEYTIPKRRGGTRTIAQPSRELKTLQRYVLLTRLVKFPIHDAAMGYVKGRNIRENAEFHRNNRVILKLYFENFFPSITVDDWNRFLSSHPIEGIERSDYRFYRQILWEL